MKIKNQLKSLKTQNKKLSSQLEELRNGFSANNSLSTLVQSAFAQSNLTSFNPIIQNNIYAPLTINWTMLTYMYKTHGVIQTAIDMPVLDSFRGGIEIKSDQLNTDEILEFTDEIEDLEIIEAITEASIWARLYGGAALIINTNQDPATPLDYRNIKKFELYPANRWELMAVWKPNDPQLSMNPWLQAANKNADEVFFYGQRIHKSRIITLSGKSAPYIIKWQLQGWGMSEVERMVEDFNLYIKTKDVLYELLQEAKIDVYRFDGLRSQLASNIGTTKTRERVELMNEFKNFNKAIVLDKMDEFEQKQITFTGIAEVMKENRIGIASALRMPLSKIFGLSAAGFSSGEDDIENYNSMVESEVRQPNRKVIKKILKLICALKYGEDIRVNFDYKPMRILSSVDEEAVKTSKSNRAFQAYDRMLLDSKEIGQIMQKEGLVSVSTCAADGLLEDHPINPQTGIPNITDVNKKGTQSDATAE